MDTGKFNALIRLLDDTDPFVAEKVEGELMTMGLDAIPRLEAAWEQAEDSLIQARIEELIHSMQFNHYTGELLQWRLAGGRNLLEGWMLLTQVQYPTLNVQKYYNEVDRLVHKSWLLFNSAMNDVDKLCAINKLLYSVEGYTGNYKEPFSPENNYLSSLLDQHRGNSLTLCALYQAIAAKLDIPLQLVNFNGYYALRYYSRDTHFYVDAYNKGILFTPPQVSHFLRKHNAPDDVRTYKHLSNTYIVLDILNHLKEHYRMQENEQKVELFGRVQERIQVAFPAEEDTTDETE